MAVVHKPWENGKDYTSVDGALHVLSSLDFNCNRGISLNNQRVLPDSIEKIAIKAFGKFAHRNALFFNSFPSLLAMETEIVSLLLGLANAPPTGVGNFTSGGTESIFCALKAAREYARQARGIKEPEVILAVSGHAAFQKSCHLLDMKCHLVPIDEKYRIKVDEVEKLINPNTILLVGSAVCYGHGVCDDIGALGQLALKHKLCLHVDACIGGFVLQFWKKLGYPVPDCDFTVPGVTSISIDLHKYAFCFKPSSVILYRDRDLRYYQCWGCGSWTGYTIVNTTFQSSKSGGPIAATWATLKSIGDDGYKRIFRKVWTATQALADGIQKIPGLKLQSWPTSNIIVTHCVDGACPFHVVDEMHKRGWFVQIQLGCKYADANFLMTVNPEATAKYPAILQALRESVEASKKMEDLDVKWRNKSIALIKEYNDSAQTREDGKVFFDNACEMVGLKTDDLPDNMADISYCLHMLPAELRELLLVNFVNEAFVYDEVAAKEQEAKLQPRINAAVRGFLVGMVKRKVLDNIKPFLFGMVVGVSLMVLKHQKKPR